jgi:hypothetical protein
MTEFVLSLIRTWVPIGVGALIAWLASIGIDAGDQASVGLTVAGTAIITGLYYLIVRTLESRFPWFGVLLGAPRTPARYTPGPNELAAQQYVGRSRAH